MRKAKSGDIISWRGIYEVSLGRYCRKACEDFLRRAPPTKFGLSDIPWLVHILTCEILSCLYSRKYNMKQPHASEHKPCQGRKVLVHSPRRHCTYRFVQH